MYGHMMYGHGHMEKCGHGHMPKHGHGHMAKCGHDHMGKSHMAHFRHFISKDEKIAHLEDYRKELEGELKGLKEYIEKLKKEK